MRLVVHMGATKTASTYLQKTLAMNEAVLRANGVFMPQTGRRTSNFNHHNLAWQLLEDRRFRPETGDWDALAAEIAADGADADIVLLSSEAFARLASDEALRATFWQHLSGLSDDVELLYVVRDPLARINSMYTQTVKTFAPPQTFTEYAAKSVKSGFYNLEESFRYWYQGDKAKFVALRFDEFVKEGPLQSLLRNLHVELPADEMKLPDDISNASPGPMAVEAMRLLNAHLRVVDAEFSRRSAATTKLSQVVQRRGAALGWYDEKYWGWDVKQAAWGADRLETSNQRFALDVWGIDWPLDIPVQNKKTAIDVVQINRKTMNSIWSYLEQMSKRYVKLVTRAARKTERDDVEDSEAEDSEAEDSDVDDADIDSDDVESDEADRAVKKPARGGHKRPSE